MAFELAADTSATSYATVEQADAIAELRGVSAWTELDDTQKEQALYAATVDLDTLDWKGLRASSEQELEWPRTGTTYSTDAWPSRLVSAVIELAFSYAADLVADSTTDVFASSTPTASNVKRKKVGPLETEYFSPTSETTIDVTTIERFPAIVQNLVRPLVRVTTTAWGSAAVVRGS